DQLSAGHRVTVPADQWGSPTYTVDLAHAAVTLVQHGHTGTYHATGPDFVNRADLASRVCARFGLDPSLLDVRPTADLHQPARRPLRVKLDTSRIRSAGVAPFRTIAAGLDGLAA